MEHRSWLAHPFGPFSCVRMRHACDRAIAAEIKNIYTRERERATSIFLSRENSNNKEGKIDVSFEESWRVNGGLYRIRCATLLPAKYISSFSALITRRRENQFSMVNRKLFHNSKIAAGLCAILASRATTARTRDNERFKL